ncbi:hypothetical protein MCOR19_001577 [Pyricularia oryzae]|uniref:Uncharacterized protein n=1 Tax=Pyricularia grisea TaxID=148305 RepID=A0ABQ8NZD0_PYRGI|nr:hypothetical protein MCOR01_010265 [Pyricularia oryzae]KAI6262224.1 hypothetical protein MCOR19_001577 [Pyricularia oryzae]KAI6304123.1 hypothetical protein MCOR33_000871 [Pyricularia grisea]KAI6592644.1 hypothetical protein MCOR12_007586 [Pyricularia oryzae]
MELSPTMHGQPRMEKPGAAQQWDRFQEAIAYLKHPTEMVPGRNSDLSASLHGYITEWSAEIKDDDSRLQAAWFDFLLEVDKR